jgi:integrase
MTASRMPSIALAQDAGLVFATHLGGPLEPRNVNRSWYAVRSRAGLDGVRLHDLRHSCALAALVACRSERVFDRLRLGWEPVSGFEPLTCRLQDGCSAN